MMDDLQHKRSGGFRSCTGRHRNQQWREHSRKNRIWTGTFILLVGVAALLRYSLPVPAWLFSWQMLLIALGLFTGLRHGFRQGPWFVLLLVGSVFLVLNFFPDLIDKRMIWPIILIAVGLFIIVKPGRRYGPNDDDPSAPKRDEDRSDALIHFDEPSTPSPDDSLESTSVFGGVKKNIFSKNFRGGELVNVFGGTELNLSQADIQGTVVLEVTQIFGGTKIIVPPHWDVKPEMAAIFGGIDDKRHIQPGTTDASKVLLLKGTSIFAGIEIKSF